MDLIEIEQEQQLIREDAAAWLAKLADSLARHNQLQFMSEGLKYTVKVPREVTMEVELEIDDDGSKLEIELSW